VASTARKEKVEALLEAGRAVGTASVIFHEAVAARLPFYEAAYAAWRLGQAALALEVVGGDDLRAWRVARARWAACLRRALLATGSGA